MIEPRHAGPMVLTLVVLVAFCLLGCHGGVDRCAAVKPGGGTSVALSQAGLRGDLNGNGTPDVTDAVGILRTIVSLDPPTALADCDCDGITGITDAIALLRCLVGLAPWPIMCGEWVPGDDRSGPDGQLLIWVPGDSFMMGTDQGADDERPVHQVTLDGFWIGECEVTNRQYAAFMNIARPTDLIHWLNFYALYCGIELVEGTYRPIPGLEAYPVVQVTWHGAAAYCRMFGYALPTEAQWEYAAAGVGTRRYPWGDLWDPTRCCNQDNTGPSAQAFPVGSIPIGMSWCGGLDLAGNVAEWCADWYGLDYYAISPALNPLGPAHGWSRVTRGGSWAEGEYSCRTTSRARDADPSSTNRDLGFRVARSST